MDFGEPRGSAQAGRRPALIVSNNINNEHSPVVIVAAITKTIPAKHYPYNVSLPEGFLRYPGTIYCSQLLTIDKSDLRLYRGELSDEKMSEVDRALAVALSLPKWGKTPPDLG